MNTNTSLKTAIHPATTWLTLLATFCLVLLARPAVAANRQVKDETFDISVTPTDGQSNIYLFYSANNANGTSNYITFIPLSDAGAGAPTVYSVTLQVPVSNVFSEQVALFSIYTPVASAPSQDFPVATVTAGMSDVAAALATNQSFESVFPVGGFTENLIQSFLSTGDSGSLSTFVQDNLSNFSSLSTGLDGLQSTSMNLMDFSDGKPAGTAGISVVPEPGSALLFLFGALPAGGVFAWKKLGPFRS